MNGFDRDIAYGKRCSRYQDRMREVNRAAFWDLVKTLSVFLPFAAFLMWGMAHLMVGWCSPQAVWFWHDMLGLVDGSHCK